MNLKTCVTGLKETSVKIINPFIGELMNIT